MEMRTHEEVASTTFLGRPLTIKLTLYEDKCAQCGAEILLPVLPDGIHFCEPCTYERFMKEVFG